MDTFKFEISFYKNDHLDVESFTHETTAFNIEDAFNNLKFELNVAAAVVAYNKESNKHLLIPQYVMEAN